MHSAWAAEDQLAAPAAASQHIEHLFDIAAGKDLRFEAPRMVVRIGVWFADPEAVQCPAVI